MTRVQVVQPVVPHYRESFFREIARRGELHLQVHASRTIANNPASVAVDEPWLDTSHACSEWLGGRLLWQHGLQLDPELGPGDVLVVDGNPRFASNWPLIAAARARGIAVVWWGHGWSATSSEARTRIRLRLMRTADVVLLYTDAERQDLAMRGFAPERLHALNNTIDQREIRTECSRWPDARLTEFQRWAGLADRKLLLFCGRLKTQPPTELETALEALQLLARRDDRYLLAVIGDGEDLPRLREIARQRGLDRHVLWLGALFEAAQSAAWFLSASAFVYPGPIGLSLLHAFAYGLPVITHDQRREHNPEIAALEDGVNGLLHRRRDANSLADQIEQVCTDDALRARLSAAALHTVQTRFSFEHMVQRFHDAMSLATRRGGITTTLECGPDQARAPLRSLSCE